MEKRDSFYIVGGNVNWYSHYGTIWKFLKKLKTELPYDSAIPLLGTYLKKTQIQKDTCTPMSTVAPVTISKTQKQPKCPSIEEWIKMWYIYTMQYF